MARGEVAQRASGLLDGDVEVREQHAGALGDEPGGDGRADAAGGAGDDGGAGEGRRTGGGHHTPPVRVTPPSMVTV